MARTYGRKQRGGGSGVPVDPAVSLRDLTVKLYDKGDGHGADWAAAAIASLRVAFFCLQNLPADDPNRVAITRRAEEFAYNLMVGTPDSDAPFTAAGDRPQRLVFSMTDPAPKPGPDHR